MDQRLKDGNLARDFAAANDGCEWPARLVQKV